MALGNGSAWPVLQQPALPQPILQWGSWSSELRRQRQIHIIPPDGFAAPLVGIQALYRGRGAFIRRCGGFAWGKFEIRYVGAAAECAGHLDG